MSAPHRTVGARALDSLRGGLVVSCQALPTMPFDGPAWTSEMARAAEFGGALGVRINTPEHISAVRAATSITILGVHKIRRPEHVIYITPTREAALSVAAAGASLVAVDATRRERWPGESLEAVVTALHEAGVAVIGDIATADDARHAEQAGVQAVATTLNGLTGTARIDPVELVRAVAKAVRIPVLMEGGVATPAQARLGLMAGAHAVVVGRAITMPHLITREFANAVAAAGPGP